MSDRTQAIANFLNDKHFQEVIKEIRDNHLQTIINSNQTDYEVREQAYQRIACINELINTLEGIAKTSDIKSKRWNIF
jgi:hypothetical protein